MRAFANEITVAKSSKKSNKKRSQKIQLILIKKSFRISIDGHQKLCIMRTSLTQSGNEATKK